MERQPIFSRCCSWAPTSLLVEDSKVGAAAPIFYCVMAPRAVSLAEKPKQKLVMVPLDLAQIQPLHPFYKIRREQPLLSPGCVAAYSRSWSTIASEKEQELFGFICYQQHISR